MVEPGKIVILNGAPRSGKSSIASVIQATFDGVWMNLGVDVLAGAATPERFRPGIGLRPGGERLDLEPLIPTLYAAMYDCVAAHARHGLNVVVDVGHHDAYSEPLGILQDAASRLADLPVLFVGVRCPIEVVMHRRADSPLGDDETVDPDGGIPDPVRRWQDEVHRGLAYDLDVDTAARTPESCAEVIRDRLTVGPRGSAFHALAGDA